MSDEDLLGHEEPEELQDIQDGSPYVPEDPPF
jgi:hypothetical protein